jgi:hypothetical protein
MSGACIISVTGETGAAMVGLFLLGFIVLGLYSLVRFVRKRVSSRIRPRTQFLHRGEGSA